MITMKAVAADDGNSGNGAVAMVAALWQRKRGSWDEGNGGAGGGSAAAVEARW